jgi:hypothetical protein
VGSETQRAAELQGLLEGIALPASRQELIDYAAGQSGGYRFRRELERLPDREFRSLDEVADALVPVQPLGDGGAPEPRAESDLPPGGADYVTPRPSSGAVRSDAPAENPPEQAIEQQTKTQNAQKEHQEKLLGT